MTKTLRNLLLLVIALATLTLVACSEDDDGPAGITGDLIGTWTGGSATINSFTINGEDLSTFLDAFIQLLIDAGASQADADAFADEFEDELSAGFTEFFEGSITFDENGTYTSTDSEGSDSGTWELTNNDQTILFDKGTEDELEVEIVSLTDTRFEGLIQISETEDIDEDGTADILAASISLVFTR